jgi:nucleoside-diphosphate-sugar epimerase
MANQRVIVTGGSGKAGHWIIRHLLDSGYSVLNVDTRLPAVAQCRTIKADLTQLGQVVSAFSPHVTPERASPAAVIHLAAIPRPHGDPNDEVFRVNSLGTYNVLEACGLLGIKRVVVASSESSYGHPFARQRLAPQFLPLDESHPQVPEDTYGLSKVVNEDTAAMFHRRDGTQILSFRIGHVMCPDDYPAIAETFADPELRAVVYWSFIDVRDLASACRLAIERDGLGCVAVNICGNETTSPLPSAELARRFYPATPLRRPLVGREGLISNAKARALLGWEPRFTAPPAA